MQISNTVQNTEEAFKFSLNVMAQHSFISDLFHLLQTEWKI